MKDANKNQQEKQIDMPEARGDVVITMALTIRRTMTKDDAMDLPHEDQVMAMAVEASEQNKLPSPSSRVECGTCGDNTTPEFTF